MNATPSARSTSDACPITGSTNFTFNFENLPDAALVRIPVACAITGLRRSTFYAAASSGRAPSILKLARGRSSGVRVGELRRYLQNPCAYFAEAARC